MFWSYVFIFYYSIIKWIGCCGCIGSWLSCRSFIWLTWIFYNVIKLSGSKAVHFTFESAFAFGHSLLCLDLSSIGHESKKEGKNWIRFYWSKNQLFASLQEEYADPSRIEQVTLTSNFRIDWHTLNIAKKEHQVNLGIKVDTKRIPVYDNNNVWVDTKPKNVIDKGRSLL